jgi:hypothetical protein
MNNSCTHFLMAWAKLEDSIRWIESQRESGLMQQTLKALKQESDSLMRQYEACTKGTI